MDGEKNIMAEGKSPSDFAAIVTSPHSEEAFSRALPAQKAPHEVGGTDCRKTPWPPLGGGSARRRWGRELHAGTKVSGKGEALSLRPFGPPPSQREVF